MSAHENVRAAVLAAATNDDSALRSVLQRGVSPNAKGHFAMRFQMNGMAAGTPEAKLPLLIIAAQSGARDSVKLLLESHADPGVKVNYQDMGTPLDSCFAFCRSVGRPYYDLDCAHLIIDAKVNPSDCGRTPDGCTELMLACQDGDLATARFLLDHDANPNLGKHNGSTALFKAAQNGHIDACRMLIQAGAHIDARFFSGATALGAAACGGHEAIVRLLLSMDADSTVVAKDGMTPSDMARHRGHHTIVSLLAEPLVDPPPRKLVPGARVTIQGVQSKPELNGQPAIILEFDRTKGRYSTALSNGKSLALKPNNVAADVSATGEDAIDITDGGAPAAVTASTPVRPDEVWTLLTSSANVTHWVSDLVRRRDFDLGHAFPTPSNQKAAGKTTHLLALAAGLMQKRNPSGPLDASNVCAQPDLVRALLESHADANACTEGGSTALHIACASSIDSHVALLIEHDADVNAMGHGAPPLMELMKANSISTDERRVACLKLLAGTGKLEVDRKDSEGYTPFLAAVEWGRGPSVLHALLALDANVNAETKHPGFTALAAASAGNTLVQPSIVKLLLEAKADASIAFSLPHMPHGEKKTSHEWATSQGRKEVVSIFAKAEYENDEPRFIAKVQQATKESADRGAAALRLIRASLRGSDVAALAQQVATDAAARPYPQGAVPTLGGRCRLQGLQGAADLNGSTGHIVD